jgi:phosphoglycolate phosphatase-like HAD superfamily hydrolase
MARAFDELFGIADAFDGIPAAGRTDAWIISDVLAKHRIARHDPRVSAFRDVYLRHLRDTIREPGPRKGTMPGIPALLETLAARDDVYLALLTGNFEAAAEVKLAYFDLWRYFACGAFGDDAPERNGLLNKAIARVVECGGPKVQPKDAVIIGDTPLDVGVARVGGARSIAVATGSSSMDDLGAAGADVVFQDLSDLPAVLSAIGV